MEKSKDPHKPVICVIDDDEHFNALLCEVLRAENFGIFSFSSPALFLDWQDTHKEKYDLIITDVDMPGLSGYELCKKIRAKLHNDRVPIIMITGNIIENDKALSFDIGADDFIQKPFRMKDLLAKIQSLLRIRSQQSKKMGQLARFIPPNIADMLVSQTEHELLKPHRALVTVMFIDLRGFTAFSEKTQPEEVMEVLNNYYIAVGNASLKYNATLGHLAGDGIMIFFNDPTPVDKHQEVAVQFALEVREALNRQKDIWVSKGHDIDFGIGLAEGHATIGGIGFERFWQYSVIGPVANFASRICNMAHEGDILVSHRFLSRMGKTDYIVEPAGRFPLKGIKKPVSAYKIISLRETKDSKKAG